MTDLRRKRKRVWKSILTTVTLGTTLPVLALLCRGHSPSRYDIANLPVWERTTPSPPKPLGHLRADPVSATSVRFVSLPMAQTLSGADENTMFGVIEDERHVPVDRLAAGKPGVWLEEAAVLGRWDADLLPKLDRVATRLMTDQAADGYLGALSPVHEYRAADIDAHANNLRGLLAYFALTHQPAALYGAMHAGDFLLDNYDPLPGQEEAGAEDTLVYALTRLYQASGEERFLQFAEREESMRGCDALGLCALYEATGNRVYLNQARHAWRYARKSTDSSTPTAESPMATPHFTAEIFMLTGDHRYLDGLRDYRSTSVWPLAVAFTRDPSTGLSINCLFPATVTLGSVQVDIRSTVHADAQTAAEVDSLPAVSPTPHPVAIESDDIDVTTKAHAAPTVHITLQPGCVAAVADRLVEISLNGKPVRYDLSTGSHFAFRPSGTGPAAKPALDRSHPSLRLTPTEGKTPEA